MNLHLYIIRLNPIHNGHVFNSVNSTHYGHVLIRLNPTHDGHVFISVNPTLMGYSIIVLSGVCDAESENNSKISGHMTSGE